ncbi:DEAD/DEAH box helicase [uncultured Paludibaculum sp.]|uniref:DEAD/DEAH box helicase n=1 Tax=uncultured Paludibaculum sp. TaxID=1765020 RepID=UPI002AAAB734|nr:DEAD/DEAH box helicase [uncultured Paludibaculum sp.]
MPLDTTGAFTHPYPFKTKPFKHQLTCWLTQKDRAAFAYFAEMGTGKSKMLLDTAAWMYDQDRINALVVIAPKGVYRNWADSELPAHLPAHIRYRLGVWAANPTRADLRALEALQRKPNDVDLLVLLMNVEALGRDIKINRAYAFLRDFLLGNNALMAIDESTTIKNPTATRTKAVMKLRLLAPVRRILTGQPAVNGPLDLYSQCEFLDPDFLGYSSYYSYRAHFAKLVKLTRHLGNGKKREFQKVTGYQNLDELNKILSRFAFIVKKEDCLDLPPKVYTTRHVELGVQQRKAYDQMKRLAIVEIEEVMKRQTGDVELVGGFELTPSETPVQGPQGPQLSTAQLVITQMLRLHQILSGFMVTDEKKVIPFDEPNPRLEDLIEALGETAGRSIIWAVYKFNVRQIAARLAEEFGPESVVTYFGETSVEDRRVAIRRFQDPNDPARFFVSNKTGARGITLTAASYVWYYGNDYDLDTRCQNEDRAHRIGQTKSVTYVDYVAPGTVDEKVVAALRSKLDISKLITASNWRQFLGAN